MNKFSDNFLFINTICLQAILAVSDFNSSFVQNTHRSRFLFFNNSILTIESFHHHTGTKYLSFISNSFFIYFFSVFILKSNSHSGDILFVYKNSHNQFI
ncbi:hypothetical protein HOG21_07020 [bacterium]|nr:hypothetical protein [bacterium]